MARPVWPHAALLGGTPPRPSPARPAARQSRQLYRGGAGRRRGRDAPGDRRSHAARRRADRALPARPAGRFGKIEWEDTKGRPHMRKITRRATMMTGLAAGTAFLSLPHAARAEGTLEQIKKRGTFRVGVTQAPPWFSKDPKTGQWTSGVGIFMGEAMAKTLGVKMTTVEVSWGNSIAALQADKIDIMFTIDATPERRKAVDFPATPLLYYSL